MNKSEEEDLASRILYYKRKYYDGEPEISDADYDKLEEKLKILNSSHPVLHIVGTPVGGKVNHNPPMLSSNKATTLDEVVKWANKIGDHSLSAGYKVDGLSLSLTYENGKLLQAATRGNGNSGDDVTLAVMVIDEIPKTIPVKERINVRGEVYMKISEFANVNSTLPKEQRFSSPRNLAVGTLRQKDVSSIQNRKLSFKAFEVLGMDENKTITELNKLLEEWGFARADFEFIENNNSEEINRIFHNIEKERELIDFEIDGVIFKYNEYLDRKDAGSTEHHPKWQLAWKFKSEDRETIINKIIWQVGRSGALTPVALVDPVELKGAIISRATLHNADFIENLNIASGDRVSIKRAGDVIPKISTVVEKGPNEFEFPLKCPSCKNPVKRDGVNLICTSIVCREKDIQSIMHWIGIVDIEHVGQKTIEKLYDLGIVQHYSDIYKDEITEDLLIRLFGRNGSKMKGSIEHSRTLQFKLFLAGLGIPTLGKKLGKVLANHFSSLEELQNTTSEELATLDGISDVTANHVLVGINDTNRAARLLQNKVEILYGEKKKISPKKSKKATTPSLAEFWDDDEALQSISSSLKESNSEQKFGNGEKIYITGSVEGYTKKKLQEFIELIGFEWSTSISKNLDFLIYGNNAGSAKLDKAREVGVNVISWDEFIKQFEIKT